MIVISLLVNVLVLVPVCTGLVANMPAVRRVYGDPSPARSILLAVYLAILCASVVLLLDREPQRVAVLLGMQVLYKVLSPLTVGSVRNPVVISNLAIAALHACTLWLIWTSAN